MRALTRFLPLLAVIALPLTACGPADGAVALADVGSTPSADADPVAEKPVGVDDVATDEPVFDCREVDGEEVCDTFDEGDEGPGTYDDSDEGPGTTG